MWNNGLEKTPEFHHDFDFRFLLSLWLVAEKQDTYVEKWILTSVAPDVERSLGKAALVWRAQLWRDLVIAEMFMNGAKTAGDAAIERFFHMYKLREANLTRSSPDYGKMSAWPATTSLAALLSHDGHVPKTSPRLYDRFLQFLRDFEGKGTEGRTNSTPC